MCYSQSQTSLCSFAGSHGGAATPPYHNLVGLTCRSAQIVANQRSAVRNSGTLRTCGRALPAHPGPFPQGEGDCVRRPSFQMGIIECRANSQAVSSPRGEGQGEEDHRQLIQTIPARIWRDPFCLQSPDPTSGPPHPELHRTAGWQPAARPPLDGALIHSWVSTPCGAAAARMAAVRRRTSLHLRFCRRNQPLKTDALTH